MRLLALIATVILFADQAGFSQTNPPPALIFSGESPFDWYGNALAADGDLNGDGVNDLALTRFASSSSGSLENGQVLLFFGGALAGEISPQARNVRIVGERPGDFFGYTVAIGDVNGDGTDDLLATSFGYNNFIGKAYIFFGGSWLAELRAEQAHVIITPSSTFTTFFGFSAAVVGDYNHDGISDVIIGANYGNDVGQVFLFWGPLRTGILSADSADVIITGENGDDLFGISAGTGKPLAAADVNGDGQDDLIVGAYSHEQGSRVHIFYGQDLKLSVTPQEANVTIIVDEYSFGSSILAGEVDGDGKADFLVEDFGDDLDSSYIGTFYLFLGATLKDNMSAEDAAWRVTGTQSQEFWSSHWSAFGDIDSNGRDDVIIASPRTKSVYIFTHPRFGQQQITTEADFIITGDSQTGITVGKPFIGNIVGSSTPELFISATMKTASMNTIGLVYVYDQGILTRVQEKVDNTPRTPSLYQNYPNPFNPGTEIRFALPAASEVQLVIYDLHGREVLQLIGQRQSAGFHAVHWNGRDQKGVPVSSGVYLYRLTAGRFSEVRKAVLLQ